MTGLCSGWCKSPYLRSCKQRDCAYYKYFDRQMSIRSHFSAVSPLQNMRCGYAMALKERSSGRPMIGVTRSLSRFSGSVELI